MDMLTGRERARLRRARENGYLHVGGRSPEALRDVYSFWCWRLRIPVVWCERLTARSKFGRVCVDLFTTPNVLNAQGQAELQRLGAASVSAHEVRWERVPWPLAERLAKGALRAVLRPGNYEAVEAEKAARGSNVLAWKIPA
jgi:hypothetical protein